MCMCVNPSLSAACDVDTLSSSGKPTVRLSVPSQHKHSHTHTWKEASIHPSIDCRHDTHQTDTPTCVHPHLTHSTHKRQRHGHTKT
mmetsp:Transcript_31080/g.90265  ORF Transcript_31080/g.90265 Transcript_31080/m.90265 type:complete len:86 (+) Transcript_31080:109-366(+)